MYAQIQNGKSKEDILKQLIEAKKDIKSADTKRVIEKQLLDDRK